MADMAGWDAKLKNYGMGSICKLSPSSPSRKWTRELREVTRATGNTRASTRTVRVTLPGLFSNVQVSCEDTRALPPSFRGLRVINYERGLGPGSLQSKELNSQAE